MTSTNGYRYGAWAVSDDGKLSVVGAHTWANQRSQTVSGKYAGRVSLGAGRPYAQLEPGQKNAYASVEDKRAVRTRLEAEGWEVQDDLVRG
jgi:hypothetical protein